MAQIQTLIELDGQSYLLNRYQLSVLKENAQVEGDKYRVTDFAGALHQLRVANAPMRYVEPVLEHSLRESGELDGFGKILSHCHYKRDSNTTLSYFTPVLATTFARYESLASQDPDHCLLFAFNTLLFKAFQTHASNQPIALLFEHDRHIELLVGDRYRIYAADRLSAFNVDSEAKQSLLSPLTHQLKNIEIEEHLKIAKVVYYHWLVDELTETDWIKALADEEYLNTPVHRVKALRYSRPDQEDAWCSILPLLKQLRVKDAVNDKAMVMHYSTYKLAPWIIAGLMLVSVATYAGKLHLDDDIDQLQHRVNQLKEAVKGNRQKAQTLQRGYEKSLSELRTLIRASSLPLISQIMAEISYSSQDKLLFEEIKITYPGNKLHLDLIGRGRMGGFAVGVPAYNQFIALMAKHHYRVIDSELLTDITSLSFKLTMEKAI